MSQPPEYDRLYNLTTYATANPAAPYDATKVDAELNAIEDTLDATLINLSLIQRDDGALRNGIVTQDSLSSALAALFAAAGSTIRGDWVTATAYALKNVVTQGGVTYICAVAHTSGTFNTDLTADKWVALNSGSTIAASSVTNTPAGAVAATDVQAAINELDTDKLAKASNLSDVATRATAFDNLVAAGGTMTGALTFSGARINEAQGSNVASASTINLDTATGNLVDVTGTTAITAITLSQGREAVVRFTGVLTLTNGASLVLPGSANITTAAGDFAVFRGYAAGVVRCVDYNRADGTSLVGNTTSATHTTPTLNGAVAGTSLATQAEMETGTATDKLVTPGTQKYHPGMAKAWVQFSVSAGTLTQNAGYNCTATRNSTGDYTITFTTAFSSANFAAITSFSADRSTISSETYASGSYRFVILRTVDSSAQEVTKASVVFFGDQ